MAADHTELPWATFPLPGCNWGIHHASPGHLGGMHADVNCLNRKTIEAIEQAEANAKFIVRACNNHAKLIAALRRLTETRDACLGSKAYDEAHVSALRAIAEAEKA